MRKLQHYWNVCSENATGFPTCFTRRHNLRRNSGEGRALMMQDLEAVHGVIFEAFKVLMILGGTDLDALAKEPFVLPLVHLSI